MNVLKISNKIVNYGWICIIQNVHLLPLIATAAQGHLFFEFQVGNPDDPGKRKGVWYNWYTFKTNVLLSNSKTKNYW